MKEVRVWNIISILTLLALVTAAFGVVFPVQAQAGTLVTPTVPAGGSTGGSVGATVVVPSSGTVVVPNTGAQAPASSGFLFSGWTLLIILLVVIIVLLIALLARGSTNHPLE